MKNYITTYKPFLLFLGKFLLTYLLLTFGYQLYLQSYNAHAFEADTITKHVAFQTQRTLELFGANAAILPNPDEAGMKLIYNGEFVARIIEGCNAISVIILYISFIVAFAGRLRNTVLFVVFGSVFIYIMNVGRIALLAWALHYYPEQEHLLHGVLFPLLIYGAVFLLWVIWVNKYSLYAKKTV